MRDFRADLRVVAVVFGLVLGNYCPVLGNTIVRFDTNMGTFDVELYDNAAPLTVANFLSYVNAGAYDQTMIDRSDHALPLVQGGNFDLTGQQIVAHAPVPLEAGLLNLRGTIGVARPNNPNSGTTAWYINETDNPYIDQPPGYAVFGHVIGSGMDVVDAIYGLPTYSFAPSLPNLPLRDYVPEDYNNAVSPLPHLVVVNSVMVVPEPSSLILATLGGLAMLRTRHRRPVAGPERRG